MTVPISVRHVPLAVHWPKPGFGTPVLLVQPDLSGLELTACGYRYPEESHEHQVAVLRSALTLARVNLSQDLPHAFVVALSEYALPSAAFDRCEAAVVELLPANAVCMAGFDAMPGELWRELLGRADNGAELRERQANCRYDWVNTAVVWIKDDKGELHRYFQAKIRPAEREQRGTMHCGDEVLYFEAGARSFSLLICFDYIAAPGEEQPDVARQLAGHLREKSLHGGQLFVLQCNERPDHPAFLGATEALFTDRAHRFGAVCYVNRAGQTGYSRIYFPSEDWPATTRDTEVDQWPEVYRRMPVSGRLLTEVSLRSARAVIHSFIYTPRAELPAVVGAQRGLLRDVRLYTIQPDGGVQPVPAPLAAYHALSQALGQAAPPVCQDPQQFAQRLNRAVLDQLCLVYGRVKAGLEQLKPERLHQLLRTLWQKLPNPDFWTDVEKADVNRLVQALYILSAGELDLQIWGGREQKIVTARCRNFTLTILAGDDRLWADDLWGTLPEEELYRLPGYHVVLVLRHVGRGPKHERVEPIDLERVGRVGAGKAVHPVADYDGQFGAKPGWDRIDAPRLYWIDRDCLLDKLREATDADDLVRLLKEVFSWQVA